MGFSTNFLSGPKSLAAEFRRHWHRALRRHYLQAEKFDLALKHLEAEDELTDGPDPYLGGSDPYLSLILGYLHWRQKNTLLALGGLNWGYEHVSKDAKYNLEEKKYFCFFVSRILNALFFLLGGPTTVETESGKRKTYSPELFSVQYDDIDFDRIRPRILKDFPIRHWESYSGWGDWSSYPHSMISRTGTEQ